MNVKQNNLDVLHGYAGITTLLQFHFSLYPFEIVSYFNSLLQVLLILLDI